MTAKQVQVLGEFNDDIGIMAETIIELKKEIEEYKAEIDRLGEIIYKFVVWEKRGAGDEIS